MKLIVELVRWLLQRGQPASEGLAAPADDGSDRTSMAEFVRLLRLHDEDGGRQNYPN